MNVGTLMDLLAQFGRERPVALMVPAHAEKIPIEVVQVVDCAYLPAEALTIVGRDDVVLIRSASV